MDGPKAMPGEPIWQSQHTKPSCLRIIPTSVTCSLLWTKTRARTPQLLPFDYSVTAPDSGLLLPDTATLSRSFFLTVCVRKRGAGSV